MRLLLGITGASGSCYAENFLQNCLDRADFQLKICLSEWGEKVFLQETGRSIEALAGSTAEIVSNSDLLHPLASGSNAPEAMVILPCSANTLAKLAVGIQDSLLLRTAACILKLRRPLVVGLREMPLSGTIINNLAVLHQAGAHVFVASPHFYHKPRSVEELIPSVTAYCFDLLGMNHSLETRWRPAE